ERKKLMYKTENNRLRNVLSRDVPEIGARACRRVVDRLLDKNDLSQSEVKHWAVHPGGTSVLEEIEKKLSLKDGELSYSHKVFENYGNMSSATVVFVLKEILENEPLRPGERLVMTSFGAGFSAHACLLEVPGGGTPGSSPFSN
ncbi:MAG: 3-oxoacyl-[acyl-carrier-protein] synthase III C-terminal domain-containing protein, partial [bacterium]